MPSRSCTGHGHGVRIVLATGHPSRRPKPAGVVGSAGHGPVTILKLTGEVAGIWWIHAKLLQSARRSIPTREPRPRKGREGNRECFCRT